MILDGRSCVSRRCCNDRLHRRRRPGHARGRRTFGFGGQAGHGLSRFIGGLLRRLLDHDGLLGGSVLFQQRPFGDAFGLHSGSGNAGDLGVRVRAGLSLTGVRLAGVRFVGLGLASIVLAGVGLVRFRLAGFGFGFGDRYGSSPPGSIRGGLRRDVMVNDVGADDRRSHRRHDLYRKFLQVIQHDPATPDAGLFAGTLGHIEGSSATDRWQFPAVPPQGFNSISRKTISEAVSLSTSCSTPALRK